MLVLTRRITKEHRDTDIFITCPNGDILQVALIQIKGKQVRIGFKTPDGYDIDRGENYENARAQREAAKTIIQTHF